MRLLRHLDEPEPGERDVVIDELNAGLQLQALQPGGGSQPLRLGAEHPAHTCSLLARCDGHLPTQSHPAWGRQNRHPTRLPSMVAMISRSAPALSARSSGVIVSSELGGSMRLPM